MPHWKDTSDLYYGLTKTWFSYFIMCSGLHLSNNLLWAQHTKSPACITDVTGFCNQICFGSSNRQTLQPFWTPQATETPHSKLINHEFCCWALVQFNKHSSPSYLTLTPIVKSKINEDNLTWIDIKCAYIVYHKAILTDIVKMWKKMTQGKYSLTVSIGIKSECSRKVLIIKCP